MDPHHDDDHGGAAEDLVSALEVIEDQPLADRAGGYLALHDELARRLDSGASA